MGAIVFRDRHPRGVCGPGRDQRFQAAPGRGQEPKICHDHLRDQPVGGESIGRKGSLVYYLSDARRRGAEVEIVLGDARLMMEREPDREFDVLAVDAFSGDSIPTHLLTDEAMTSYHRHLSPEGILAIHISIRYLDLEPVCKALAVKHGYEARVVDESGDSTESSYTSSWVLLTHDVSLVAMLTIPTIMRDRSSQTRYPLDRRLFQSVRGSFEQSIRHGDRNGLGYALVPEVAKPTNDHRTQTRTAMVGGRVDLYEDLARDGTNRKKTFGFE